MEIMDDSQNTLEDEKKDILGGPRIVRSSDPDVFSDPDSARIRSRQIGCIGIRRYNNRDGKESWMPCTNESDFRKYTGQGVSGRRFRRQQLESDLRAINGRNKKKTAKQETSVPHRDKASNYTKPEARDNLKARIMASSNGGKAGEWTARKAQLLAMAYKKIGGGYVSKSNSKHSKLSSVSISKLNNRINRDTSRGKKSRHYSPAKTWDISSGSKTVNEISSGSWGTGSMDTSSKRATRGIKHIEFYEELDVKALGSKLGRAIAREKVPNAGTKPSTGRLGRRTLRSFKPIPGDPNPMTRPDADGDGVLFDGTWREMPDPTPGSDFTVAGKLRRRAMGLPQIAKKPGEKEPKIRKISGQTPEIAPSVVRAERAIRNVREDLSKTKVPKPKPQAARIPVQKLENEPHSILDGDTWKKLFNEFQDGESSVDALAKKYNVYRDEVTDFVKKENLRRKRNEDSFKNSSPETYSRIKNDLKFIREDAIDAIRDGKIKSWDDLAQWALNDKDIRRNPADDRAERELFRAFPEGVSPDGNSDLVLGFKPSSRDANLKVRTIANNTNTPRDFQKLRPAMRSTIESAGSQSSFNERAATRRATRVERTSRTPGEVYGAGITGRMAGTPPSGNNNPMSAKEKQQWKLRKWKRNLLEEWATDPQLATYGPELFALTDFADARDGFRAIRAMDDAEVDGLFEFTLNGRKNAGLPMPMWSRNTSPLAPDELAQAAQIKRPLVGAFLDEYRKYSPDGYLSRLDINGMSDEDVADFWDTFILPELVDPTTTNPQSVIDTVAAASADMNDRRSLADEILESVDDTYMDMAFKRKLAERRINEMGIDSNDPNFDQAVQDMLNRPDGLVPDPAQGASLPAIRQRQSTDDMSVDEFLAYLDSMANGTLDVNDPAPINPATGKPWQEKDWEEAMLEIQAEGEKLQQEQMELQQRIEDWYYKQEALLEVAYQAGWMERPREEDEFGEPEDGMPDAEEPFEDAFGYLDQDWVWAGSDDPSAVDPEDPSTWGNNPMNINPDTGLPYDPQADSQMLPRDVFERYLNSPEWWDMTNSHIMQRYQNVEPELIDGEGTSELSRGMGIDGLPLGELVRPDETFAWDDFIAVMEEMSGPLPRRSDGSIDINALPSGVYSAATMGIVNGENFDVDVSARRSGAELRKAVEEKIAEQKTQLLDKGAKAKKERARFWSLFESQGLSFSEIAQDENILDEKIVADALKMHAVDNGISNQDFARIRQTADAGVSQRFGDYQKKRLDKIRNEFGRKRTDSSTVKRQIREEITRLEEVKAKSGLEYDSIRREQKNIRNAIKNMLIQRPPSLLARKTGRQDENGNDIWTRGWRPDKESFARYLNRQRRFDRQFIGYDDPDTGESIRGPLYWFMQHDQLLTRRTGGDGASRVTARITKAADQKISDLRAIESEIDSALSTARNLGVSGFMRGNDSSIPNMSENRARQAGKNAALGLSVPRDPNILRDFDGDSFSIYKRMRSNFAGLNKNLKEAISSSRGRRQKRYQDTVAFRYASPEMRHMFRELDKIPGGIEDVPTAVRPSKRKIRGLSESADSNIVNYLNRAPVEDIQIDPFGITGLMGKRKADYLRNRKDNARAWRTGKYKPRAGEKPVALDVEVRNTFDSITGQAEGLYVVDRNTGNTLSGPHRDMRTATAEMLGVQKAGWPLPWETHELIAESRNNMGWSRRALIPYQSDAHIGYDASDAADDWVIGKDQGQMQRAADSVVLRRNPETNELEVMMVQRGFGPHRASTTDMWVLPGGFVDKGETGSNAASRELLEEVGIDTANLANVSTRELGTIKSKDWDVRFSGGVEVNATKFVVSPDAEFKAADDAVGARWIPVRDIANGNITTGFGHVAWIRDAVDDELDYEDDSMFIRNGLVHAEKMQKFRNREVMKRANVLRREKAKESGRTDIKFFDLESLPPVDRPTEIDDPNMYQSRRAEKSRTSLLRKPFTEAGVSEMNRRGKANTEAEWEGKPGQNWQGVGGFMTSGDAMRKTAFMHTSGKSYEDIAKQFDVPSDNVKTLLESMGYKASKTSQKLEDNDRSIFMALTHDRVPMSKAKKTFNMTSEELQKAQERYSKVVESSEPAINSIYRDALSRHNIPGISAGDRQVLLRRLDGASFDEMRNMMGMSEQDYSSFEDKLFSKVRNADERLTKRSGANFNLDNIDSMFAKENTYMMAAHQAGGASRASKRLNIPESMVNAHVRNHRAFINSFDKERRQAFKRALANYGDAVLTPSELSMMRRLGDGESTIRFAKRNNMPIRTAQDIQSHAIQKMAVASNATVGSKSKENNILNAMPEQWMNPVIARDLGRVTAKSISGKMGIPPVNTGEEAHDWNDKKRAYINMPLDELSSKAIKLSKKINKKGTLDINDADVEEFALHAGWYAHRRIAKAKREAPAGFQINEAKVTGEVADELGVRPMQLTRLMSLAQFYDRHRWPWRGWDKNNEEWKRHEPISKHFHSYSLDHPAGRARYKSHGFYMGLTEEEDKAFLDAIDEVAGRESPTGGETFENNVIYPNIPQWNRNNGITGKMGASGPRQWQDKDYYSDLGVSPDSSDDVIKKAYRKRAAETHPDVNPDNPQAEEEFKKISEAYEVLSDTPTRNQYDRHRGIRSSLTGTPASSTADEASPQYDPTDTTVSSSRKRRLSSDDWPDVPFTQDTQFPRNRKWSTEEFDEYDDWVRHSKQPKRGPGSATPKRGPDKPDEPNGSGENTGGFGVKPKRPGPGGFPGPASGFGDAPISPEDEAAIRQAIDDDYLDGGFDNSPRGRGPKASKKKLINSGISGKMSAGPLQPIDDTMQKRVGKLDTPSYLTDKEINDPRAIDTSQFYAPLKGEESVDVTATFGGTRKIWKERFDNTYTPMVNAIIATVTKRKKTGPKQFISVGGSAGSGKSTDRRLGTHGIPKADAAVHVDADEIKTLFPEARQLHAAGNPHWASAVHEESKTIADMSIVQALEEGLDVVYDSTGQYNAGFGTLTAARAKGYDIIAHYNVAPESALTSNVEARQKTDPRRLPSSFITAVMNTNYRIMPKVAEFADEFYLWDSEDITTRKLLAEKKKGGTLKILDPLAYVHADFDDTNQTVKMTGRPTIKVDPKPVSKGSRDGQILTSFESGKSIEKIAEEMKLPRRTVFDAVTKRRIDPSIKDYVPPVVRPTEPAVRKPEKFVEDDDLKNTFDALPDLDKQLVRDVINKQPGAMDKFNEKDLPLDLLIWASQNNISGKMSAMPADGFKPYISAEDRKKIPTFKGKPWKDVEESLNGMPWPFKGQAEQFEKIGPPGLSYFKGTGNGLKPNQWVDCLLWRDDSGILKGIVYHYPQDLPLEKKGNMNVFISPDSKRQGIASRLVAEAIKRYNVDLRQQRYSEEGAAFINNFVRNLPENKGK